MGKQKNTAKRHRDRLHQRKEKLVLKYTMIRDGHLKCDDKKKSLDLIAEQLERRGWKIDEVLAR